VIRSLLSRLLPVRPPLYEVSAWYPCSGRRVVLATVRGREEARARVRLLNDRRLATTHVYEAHEREG